MIKPKWLVREVLRGKTGCCNGFENLYIVGEGSGYSGGIISSGSDGIKAAMNIVEKNSHCNISVG